MDKGHRETDDLIENVQVKIARNYKQAVDETQAKLDTYFRKFQAKDNEWQRKVAAGEKSAEDYQAWRQSQITVGKRWEAMRDQLARDYHEANVAARAVVKEYLPEAYSLNYNFATYTVENQGLVDTQFTLYNKEAAKKLLTDNPELLKPMGEPLNAGKDIAWQKGQLQSVIFQSMVQGESIPNTARRIAHTMGARNYASAVRYARTAMTAAQNLARQDAFERAAKMGVKQRRKWVAVLDNRTRHDHRAADGQIRELDEPFEVGGEKMMFPGDPSAPAHLVWNCRCDLRSVVDGWEDKVGALRSRAAIGNMSYEDWKAGKTNGSSSRNRSSGNKARKSSR